MRKKYFLQWFVFIIVLLIPFIFADVNVTNETNITSPHSIPELEEFGEEFGFEPGKILGAGIKITLLEEKFLIEFIENNAAVLLNSNNLFHSIESNFEALAYISITSDLEVVLADFTSLGWEFEVDIGNRSIKVPPKTRLIYDGETIDLKVVDGSKLEDFDWDLLRYFNGFGKPIYIEGNAIKLEEDFSIDGRMAITNQGYLIENGAAIYHGNFFMVKENKNKVLVANKNQDMSDYKGNWIRQTKNKLEIQSSEEGNIKMNFLDNHSILNTDSKDELVLEISKGDGINIISRLEEGLIPKIAHSSSENGVTTIYNDNMELIYDQKGLSIKPPTGITREDFALEKDYQSVAMEIKSDSNKIKENLRINSYRQYIMTSSEDKETVKYNTFGLPISDKINDNSMQTLSQLKEKYPSINFTVPQFEEFSLFSIKINPYNKSHVPPYLIYLTDQFLQQNPESLEVVEIIQLVDKFNAAAGNGNTLIIGRRAVDASESEFTERGIRENKNPMKILVHEYEHIKDQRIDQREQEIIKEKGSPEIRMLYGRYEKLEEEIKDILDRRKIKYAANETEEARMLSDELKIKNKKARELQAKIEEKYYEKNPTLQQKYNEIVINAKKEFLKQDGVSKQISILKERMNKQYISNELDKIIKELFGENETRTNFIMKEYFYDSEKDLMADFGDSEGYLNSIIINNLKYSEKVSEEGWISYSSKDLPEDILNKLSELENLGLGTSNVGEMLEETKSGEFLEESIKKEDEFYDVFSRAYNSVQANPKLKNIRHSFDQIIRTNSGLFYTYSARNYDFDDLTTVASANYHELSSTYMEQSIKQRKQWIEGGIPRVSEMYKKITQLAFDSGKISISDYKYLMPEGHCEQPDCSDQLCVDYKLLCCVENPGVPNC